jgi:hypothetical protein
MGTVPQSTGFPISPILQDFRHPHFWKPPNIRAIHSHSKSLFVASSSDRALLIPGASLPEVQGWSIAMLCYVKVLEIQNINLKNMVHKRNHPKVAASFESFRLVRYNYNLPRLMKNMVG